MTNGRVKIYRIGPGLGAPYIVTYIIFERIDYMYLGRVVDHPSYRVLNHRSLLDGQHVDEERPDFEFVWEDL